MIPDASPRTVTKSMSAVRAVFCHSRAACSRGWRGRRNTGLRGRGLEPNTAASIPGHWQSHPVHREGAPVRTGKVGPATAPAGPLRACRVAASRLFVSATSLWTHRHTDTHPQAAQKGDGSISSTVSGTPASSTGTPGAWAAPYRHSVVFTWPLSFHHPPALNSEQDQPSFPEAPVLSPLALLPHTISARGPSPPSSPGGHGWASVCSHPSHRRGPKNH